MNGLIICLKIMFSWVTYTIKEVDATMFMIRLENFNDLKRLNNENAINSKKILSFRAKKSILVEKISKC